MLCKHRWGLFIRTEVASRVSPLTSPALWAPCSSFVPPPLVWQRADDNRWRALITSSQHKTNSYPASSGGVSTAGKKRRDGGGRGGREPKGSWAVQSSSPVPIHLPDTCTQLYTNTHNPHKHMGLKSHAAFHFYGSEDRSADLVIIYDRPQYFWD